MTYDRFLDTRAEFSKNIMSRRNWVGRQLLEQRATIAHLRSTTGIGINQQTEPERTASLVIVN